MNPPPPPVRRPSSIPLRWWAPALTVVVVCIVVGLFLRACSAPEPGTAYGVRKSPATAQSESPEFAIRKPESCLLAPAETLNEIARTLRKGTRLGVAAAVGSEGRLFIAARIDSEAGAEFRTEPGLWVVVAGRVYAVAADTWAISSAPSAATIGIFPDDDDANDATVCASAG